ncbi:MAG: phage holin family protein [Dongiaceae bacterium]
MIGGLLRGLYLTAAFRQGADEVKASVRRAVRSAALSLIALLLVACGAGFLVAAGFMALADEIGAIEASLVIGIAFAVAGGGMLAAVGARRRPPTPAHLSNPPSPLSKPLLDVGQEIGAAASRNPMTFVLAAFVAGLLLSRGRR